MFPLTHYNETSYNKTVLTHLRLFAVRLHFSVSAGLIPSCDFSVGRKVWFSVCELTRVFFCPQMEKLTISADPKLLSPYRRNNLHFGFFKVLGQLFACKITVQKNRQSGTFRMRLVSNRYVKVRYLV